MSKRVLSLNVNGRAHEIAAADGALLLDVLRDALALTGTKQGCDGGECGACTVLVDDRPRLACSTLAVQVEGVKIIETVEGPGAPGPAVGGAAGLPRQAGRAVRLLHAGHGDGVRGAAARQPDPSVDEIKTALAGNLCRCTGYVKIVESVRAAAAAKGGTR